MFRASSARNSCIQDTVVYSCIQDTVVYSCIQDTVVYMQHMVLSLSVRVPGGLLVHSLSESSWWPVGTQLE